MVSYLLLVGERPIAEGREWEVLTEHVCSCIMLLSSLNLMEPDSGAIKH